MLNVESFEVSVGCNELTVNSSCGEVIAVETLIGVNFVGNSFSNEEPNVEASF